MPVPAQSVQTGAPSRIRHRNPVRPERVAELVRRNPEAAAAVSFGAGQAREAASDDDHSSQYSPTPAPVSSLADPEESDRSGLDEPDLRGTDHDAASAAISPVRKAAIVLVSLDQSLASQLLSHLDRPAVEAVTWEIATARPSRSG